MKLHNHDKHRLIITDTFNHLESMRGLICTK